MITRTHSAVPGHTPDPAAITTEGGIHCPVEVTIRAIAGRWKPMLLFQLLDGPRHFGALRRGVPAATQRMTTLHLRELERDGLIRRTVLAGPVTRVEYALTAHGRSLTPVMEAMAAWGRTHPPG